MNKNAKTLDSIIESVINVGDLRQMVMEASDGFQAPKGDDVDDENLKNGEYEKGGVKPKDTQKPNGKQEFKPVLGDSVTKDNKKNNDETYKNADDVVNANQKLSKLKTGDKTQAGGENRDMSSIMYDAKDKKFTERTKAQLKGYDNAEAEKLHKDDEYGNADFGTDEDVENLAKKADAVKKDKDTLKSIGLNAREEDKERIKKATTTQFKENKIKRLNFKNTRFLGENNMKEYIPDEFKVEGRRFYMKDKYENEYLVEWTDGGADVLSYNNKNRIDEEFQRIKALMNYNSSDVYGKTTGAERAGADNALNGVLKTSRTMKLDEE